MFYTFEQKGRRNLIGEHYVCIEGDTLDEVNERAVEFEISFNAVDQNFRPKWEPATDPELLREFPELNGERLEDFRYEEYIIVYKDDNMKSTLACPLEDEYDPLARSDP